ncbi:MAG: TonB-dependent receptor, partial [Phaeodactylibacter sp.]|nr:TonB-dependent receptor [Phaeodactylibacter sp.]
EISVSLLEEVEVTATKSTLNLGLDRRAYNVDADIMAQSSSATEILQNLPSVTVDVNGQVSLRGTSNITYLINGRPSALLRAGGAAALQQIPANSIERIEVITNPSAKYRPDGIGGIINIVLKDATRQGLNGTVQANVGNLDRYNANILLNYGAEDVNFFGSYGIRHASTPQDITDIRIDREGGADINTFKSVSDVTFGELSHLATAGVTFPVGESGQVEIAGEYFYLNNDNNSFTKWDVTEEDATSLFDIDRQYNGYEQEYDVGIAYEREFENNEDHSLAIEFNLSGYDETEDNNYNEIYKSPFAGNAISRNLIEKGGPVMEFVVEYARPIGRESELELGYLGEIMKDDINILGEDFLSPENKWETDPLKTYRFKFNQTVHAGYGLFTHTIESFFFSAGLRAEQTLITSNLVSSGEKIPNDYFNIFPTLALGLELGDNEEIQLSYSKRINRADPDEQNPFPEYDDPRTRDRGNPKLLPEQVHSVELAYHLQNEKFTFMPSLYYRYLYDGFTEFREIVEDTVLQTTFTNFSNQTLAGAEVIFKGNVSNFLDLNFSANAYYSELDGTSLGLPANQSQITWDTKLGANFTISKTTYGQLNAQYVSNRLTPQGEFQPIVLLNLGLRQDIFNRNASILFTVSDVFASVEWESLIDNENLYWNTTYGRNNQIFYLGFSYRFGQSYANKRKRKPEKLEFEDAIEVPNPVPKEEDEE